MDKVYFEGRVNGHLQSYQEWCDMADEPNIGEAAKARRMVHATNELAEAAKLVDRTDRMGVSLDVSLDQLPVTRIKLKEENRLLQGQLSEAATTVEDLRKEVARVNAACAEIDADAEAHARRMERVAVIGGGITFILGLVAGMMV